MVFGKAPRLLERIWWTARGLALVVIIVGMAPTAAVGEETRLEALGSSGFNDEAPSPPNRQVVAEFTELQSFDVDTTTDTEVVRLRAEVANRVLRASASYLRALDNVSRRTAEYEQLLSDEADAVEALKEAERGLTQLALSRFMNADVVDRYRGLPPGLDDGQWSEGLTTHATDQLTGRRRRLTDDLTEIATAVEGAEEALERTRQRADIAADTIKEERSALVAFERWATEHRRRSDRADRIASSRSDDVALRSVAGTLTVAAHIEADIDRLVADARQEGIDLGGGGYRTTSEQQALRLANCDSSHPATDPHIGPEAFTEAEGPDARHHAYVVFEAPASACKPPTAPPGASQHQTGQAIDFTSNGSILTSNSPEFRWLQRNAATYGLENLPSEPWHWSTDGR